MRGKGQADTAEDCLALVKLFVLEPTIYWLRPSPWVYRELHGYLMSLLEDITH